MRDTSHDMLLVEPLPISGGTASQGSGAANLLTPDPKEVWAGAAGATSAVLSFDLGAVRAIDTIFLGFTNAPSGTSWSISGGVAGYAETALLASSAFAAPGDIVERPCGLAVLAAPTSVRYVALTLVCPAATLQAGVVVIGRSWRPEWPKELGPARGAIDTGSKDRLAAGGFGLGDGVVKATYKWTFGDLSTAEQRALWAIVRRRGERRAILLIEDPADPDTLADGIHYGLFDRLEAYERIAPGKSRWAMSMEEWA